MEDRKLGLWMCVALVVGNTIGSGIFLLPATLAPYGLNSLFAWLATSFGAVMLACVFSGLGNAFPEEEGSYGYVRLAFGDLAAFVVAWGYWIAVWVGNAAIAQGDERSAPMVQDEADDGDDEHERDEQGQSHVSDRGLEVGSGSE